jgi:hypothetical protein
MVLIISLLLALVPLLGVLWIILYGTITTVDGLFMSLILLAMSGILGLNALYEMRKRKPGAVPQALAAASASGELVHKGKIESVEFYESNVGQPNKSIVQLLLAPSSLQMLVFEGDLRNALPVGQRVEIISRKRSGYNELLNVSYS